MTTTPPADDAGDYEDEPEDEQGAKFLDLAVNTLAGAVTGAVGYAVGGPGGALVSNTATPFLAAVFRKAVGPFWEDRSRRQEKMLETAAETAGLTQEQLADRAAESEESRFLTDKALKAAAETIWPAGVRAIGRAYAASLLAKDKPVLDIRLRVLGIMQDLDEMHVRLLDLLVRYEPKFEWDGREHVTIPYIRAPSADQGLEGETAEYPGLWTAGSRMWTTWQIGEVMPEIEQVLLSLLGELRERGLALDNDTAPAAMKLLSDELTGQVNTYAFKLELGKAMKPVKLRETSVQPPEPSWSPTELGKKVLGFYVEAGTEESQDPGRNSGQEPGR